MAIPLVKFMNFVIKPYEIEVLLDQHRVTLVPLIFYSMVWSHHRAATP
jgi:hypothetical protein